MGLANLSERCVDLRRDSGHTNIATTLRVLHCIASLGGGGAERQLSYLSAELAKRGVDVHIAYHLRGPNLRGILVSGATLHELRIRNNYDPMLLWQLVRTIRKVKPDLIQTWLPQMDILGGLAGILTMTPFITSERSSSSFYKGTWKDWLRGLVGRRALKIVANSMGGKEYWESMKDSRLVTVIRNGIPVEKIMAAPLLPYKNIRLDQDAELILFAGRYSPEKNLDGLLEAIRQVLSIRTGAMAFLFGNGPLKKDLIANVQRYRLSDQVIVGDYTSELWSWIKRASVFVSVSLVEGSPNTVLEAAISGCPLVLSDIPQHRELLGDESAFFVFPHEPADIARGILEALRDQVGAKRKADSAYERLACFSVEAVTTQYVDLYRSVLARPNSGQSGKKSQLSTT